MRYSVTLGAVLCALAMSGCAADVAPEPTDQPPAMSDDHSAVGGESGQSSALVQPNVTTPAIVHTFGDGCTIRFWCRNDNAAGDLAGFCILNQCNGTAPAHAAAFCSSTCPASNCASITNFGACGPG